MSLDKDCCLETFSEAFREGKKKERERIIKLLEPLGCEANGLEHDCDNGLGYTTAADLIALIKDESKMIYSELLPDGTIYIEEVKGEQND